MMEEVQKPIIEVSLDTELDLVIAYKKAMQLAEISGLNFTEQTKFATAVSEISRNALVHVGKGDIKFYITKDGQSFFIEAIVHDSGPGIKDLGSLLKKLELQTGGQRTGLVNCKRLSDKFEMDSSEEEGTCVRIGRRLPGSHPPINHMILSGWRKHFSQLAPISPYDELKRQNILLLKTLEELRVKKTQAQEQLEEIQVLHLELENNYHKNKQLSDDYARQNELLLKRNEELDEFAHIVSHDLKSPLNNLKGTLKLMEMGQIDQEKTVVVFKGQLQKMENLIQSVLAYSRAGHEKLEKTTVDVGELLKEMENNIVLPEGFTLEIERNFPVLFTEKIFLYQIFSNLLSNALKYNDKVEGRIIVGYEQNETGDFCFFVEDNGPGIPLKKREKVFKIFTVLENTKKADSTGIGLAIVKKIITEKGGKIWIEEAKAPGEGSRFCFTWPAELVQ
ncbi:ATP-binding protein [Nafulsella turpanensis]|uniref:ATP-binding protein n=1 Tax=Nafulsella turpanensis TaxID=1265690 RepID=UPI000379A6EB|nr:ATP-binding protein [Nafulsella turpanensis]